jgi:hypothetical protein
VTVVIVGAAKFRIEVTPLLPYVGALYCGLLLAGFIGFKLQDARMRQRTSSCREESTFRLSIPYRYVGIGHGAA